MPLPTAFLDRSSGPPSRCLITPVRSRQHTSGLGAAGRRRRRYGRALREALADALLGLLHVDPGEADFQIEGSRQQARKIQAPVGARAEQNPRDSALQDVERDARPPSLVPEARIAAETAIVADDEDLARRDRVAGERLLDRFAHREISLVAQILDGEATANRQLARHVDIRAGITGVNPPVVDEQAPLFESHMVPRNADDALDDRLGSVGSRETARAKYDQVAPPRRFLAETRFRKWSRQAVSETVHQNPIADLQRRKHGGTHDSIGRDHRPAHAEP